MNPAKPEFDAGPCSQSVGDLIKQLGRDGVSLFKQEFALAKVELGPKLRALRNSALLVAVGAAICILACLTLTTALVLLLARVVAAWLAAAAVASALALGGGCLLVLGIQRLRRIDPRPHATLSRLQRDIEALRSAGSSGSGPRAELRR